jgi:hypothetical protein
MASSRLDTIDFVFDSSPTGCTLISFAICRFPAADLATSAARAFASSECHRSSQRYPVLVRVIGNGNVFQVRLLQGLS